MSSIGEQFKQCRLLHRLTQKQMADRLHISRKHYADIERSFKQPPYDLVVRMSETLRTTFTISSIKNARTLRNGTHPHRRR